MGIEDLLEEAKFEMVSRRYDKAERFLKRILREDPKNIDALFNLGVLYEIKHQDSRAMEYFNQVLEIDPEHKEAREHAEKLTEL